MKKYFQMGLLSLFIVGVFSACERMSGINAYVFPDKPAEAQNITEEKAALDEEVQQALHKDAKLARRMPLKQFARHMKKRHAYYRDYHTEYQDEFVKIAISGDKMRIETSKGKVKIEYSQES